MPNYDTWIGQTAYDSDNKKVGTIADLYLEDGTNDPMWATIKASSLFGSKTHFAPVRYADEIDDGVRFNVTEDMIKDAPSLDADGEISDDEERRLQDYYASAHGGDDDGTDSGDGHDASGPDTDTAMTRSEEQVSVNKETHQTGVARLKKYIVTKQVHTTVPVQKEVVSLEREPITDENRGDALNGADLTEEEHEMTLNEEKVVVSKETVPVERVKMSKNIVTDQVDVDETVRKEKIDVDES